MTATSTLGKKRDLLGPLHKLITALSDLSGDAAKLELMDNDQASRRLKKRVAEIRHEELKVFSDCIYNVRDDINQKKKDKSNKIKTI